MELADHPFMVGSQFHPEFRSRPDRPQPLFREFIGACNFRRTGIEAGMIAPEREHAVAAGAE
jgi:CTP synthase